VLNSDGFNSTKAVGRVFLTGWMAVDQSIRNCGHEDIRRILVYLRSPCSKFTCAITKSAHTDQ